jgi:AraC family cel operon transcriptional repressor
LKRSIPDPGPRPRAGLDGLLIIKRLAQRLDTAIRSRAQLDLFLLEMMFLGRHAAPAENRSPIIADWLQAACDGIKNPKHLEAGLESFYRLAGRSADHVARACRRQLGISPTEVVNSARLEHAATRLSASDDSILDIADECGLPNMAHFYKLFAARFGTTPRRYRMQARLIVGRNSPEKKGQRMRGL